MFLCAVSQQQKKNNQKTLFLMIKTNRKNLINKCIKRSFSTFLMFMLMEFPIFLLYFFHSHHRKWIFFNIFCLLASHLDKHFKCLEFSFKLVSPHFIHFFHYRMFQPPAKKGEEMLLMFVILKAPVLFSFVLHHSCFLFSFIIDDSIFQMGARAAFLFFLPLWPQNLSLGRSTLCL